MNAYDIIQWNNKFMIFGTDLFICIFNSEEYTVTKKIMNQIVGVKKIIINNLGESLICSDKAGNILLYKIC